MILYEIVWGQLEESWFPLITENVASPLYLQLLWAPFNELVNSYRYSLFLFFFFTWLVPFSIISRFNLFLFSPFCRERVFRFRLNPYRNLNGKLLINHVRFYLIEIMIFREIQIFTFLSLKHNYKPL